jgi:hypothetical protein
MATENVVAYIFHESVVCESEFRSVRELKKDSVLIEAVIQEAELPNRNKRKYPKAVIQNALESPFVKEKVRTKSWLGEANHPVTTDINRQLNVDMNNASHVIKKTWWDVADPYLLIAQIQTAGTTTGRNMAGLILENEMECSFSMRGLGDVIKNRDGSVTVKQPMRLVTYDLVGYPSHEKAYQRKIISEALEVNVAQLAAYAGSHCNDFKSLNEDYLNLTNSAILFDLNEKHELVVKEKATGKVKVVMLLETKMQNEINDAMKRLF